MKRTSFLVAIVAAITCACLSTASSAFAEGACGGGTTISQLTAGWEQHEVADDVVALTGNHVGLDGSAQHLAANGLEWATVVQSGWSANYTCEGGRFVYVGQAYHQAGERVLVLKREAPAAGHTGWVNTHFPTGCGNKRGRVKVKIARHPRRKHHAAKKRKVVRKTHTCVPNIQVGSQCSSSSQTGSTNVFVSVNAGNNNGNGNGGNGNGSGNGGSANQTQEQEQQQQQAQQQCAQAGGLWANNSCDMRMVTCQQKGGHWSVTLQVCEMPEPPKECTTCSCQHNCHEEQPRCPNGEVIPPGGGCKNGTETPAPGQGETPPGENPPDENPVSAQCWNENDPSQPVSPVWNTGTHTWDCPAGSFGS